MVSGHRCLPGTLDEALVIFALNWKKYETNVFRSSWREGRKVASFSSLTMRQAWSGPDRSRRLTNRTLLTWGVVADIGEIAQSRKAVKPQKSNAKRRRFSR